jgi:hypothetical protein
MLARRYGTYGEMARVTVSVRTARGASLRRCVRKNAAPVATTRTAKRTWVSLAWR